MTQTESLPLFGVHIKSSTKVVRYGFAFTISALAFLLTFWLRPLVSSNLFDLFLGAVILTALYAGLGPALLAAGISILALDYFFIPPLNTFSVGIADLFRLIIFGAVAVVTSSLSARLQQAKSDLQRAHDDLELRIAQRTEDLSLSNTRLIDEIEHRLEAERAMLEISNREQQRLGQDLHDGLCQTLAGIRLLSEELKNSLIVRGGPEVAAIQTIESRLSEALAQADVVSRGLYPVELETNGLMAALRELTHKIPKIYPVTCRFHCPRSVLISDSTVANHLYRIAQEAIMNAIKGGRAKIITVWLGERHGLVLLSILDNGIGFQVRPARQGMGLRIMEYRTRMINGSLRIQSGRLSGTRVRCAVSMNRPERTTPRDYKTNDQAINA